MPVNRPRPEPSSHPISRRTVLRGSLIAAAAAGLPAVSPPVRAVAAGGGRSVAVFGGGVSGLTAAHELSERGYQVTVYEPVALGGKARSMSVPGTGAGGRLDLPGEHGFRFFPGCYQHIPETMSRIPFPGNARGVADNLVRVQAATVAFRDLPPVVTPVEVGGLAEITPETLRTTLAAAVGLIPRLPPQELALFTQKMLRWFTSSTERRFGEWEYRSWAQVMEADGKSDAYREYLVNALTRITVAAKPYRSSARTIGTIGEALVLAGTGLVPQYGGGVDRILNRPTNEAWIDPWVAHLRGLGVRFELGAKAIGLELDNGRITSARVSGGADGRVDADWYICAMPVERAVPLLSDDILDADPRLAGMRDLEVDWMVGIQYYLTRPTDLPEGHIAALGTPWALTALRQAAMWVGDFASRYGDGSVVECLSVDVSDWDTPGIVFGKSAKDCTKDEVAQEVWAQLSAWLNNSTGWLREDDIHSWFLDPGVHWTGGAATNDTPLLVNTIGSWDNRPEAATAIPNLFFAGDHVRTHIDLATMEGANESGRAAANALLDAAGDPGSRAPIYPLYAPPVFEPLKALDADRYRAGLPHLLDA
ncbi:NAD(P)-binding protein [Nocardia sp. CT2-14]|uniref:NAD(P)-binding protein n=1 Tax=Nocardia aurantiaca TaxID=2675850 RepID=A0A6I3L8V5_9NOCA|nr:NAD(P)-binding protein [Nocardia aurantiaca]